MGAIGHIGIALGLGFALISALPALAEPLPVPALKAKVGSSMARWEVAARSLDRTRNEQSTLEHRIAALKSLEASRPVKSGVELEALLKSSLAADEVLKGALKGEATLRRAAGDAVKDAIQSLDGEMRQLVPALKTGTIESRTQAAKRIALLKDTRDELRGQLTKLREPAQNTKAWATYDVPIGPLDGPTELKEKADLVEDTREKLQKKRAALAKLIEDARAEQQLAQAARDFATDVTLFDEESRTGRVQRKGATTLAVADNKQSTSGNRNEQVTTQVPTALGDPAPAAPPAERGSAADGASFEASGVSTPPVSPPPATKVSTPAPAVAPSAAAQTNVSAPISKDVNASVLLSLRIEELAARGVDLVTLERLITELKQIDGHLAEQAGQIRALAKQLEADEAKALGKH